MKTENTSNIKNLLRTYDASGSLKRKQLNGEKYIEKICFGNNLKLFISERKISWNCSMGGSIEEAMNKGYEETKRYFIST